ncbi:MAG: type II secretion system ATPase GspE [Deltaproteobacteria bacterium]|nr:type II secretion system ATPase GspE [Deltaproteobacteria bacterium]
MEPLDGVPFKERIEERDVDTAFIGRLPLAFVKRNLVFPLRECDGRLLVAITGSKALYALDEVERACGLPISPVIVPREAVVNAIHRFYERISGSAEEVVAGLQEESLEAIASRFEEPKDLLDLADEAPVIKLLNSLLFQAVKERASDIHIEPFEKDVDVRFRRDGVLSTVISPPKVVQEALISRVKIMSGLDIAERRLPQDGRIRLLVAGKDIDVRVSVVPTSFGERAVLRLLDRKTGSLRLSDLGLSDNQVATLERLLNRNNGIILSTGPTGSGKTTTLYAALNRINTEERNIITIEDPVEYQLRGIGQIQVNSKIGLTFASGLRSILRQDPDIIMVGEIRDLETAEMAIQASLTGHLVLSTLHTNNAPSAVTRLVDMGVQSYLLSSSLTAVIAQRLIRVLCEKCKKEHGITDKEAALFSDPPKAIFKPTGCDACLKTGYSGQTGIFEFLDVDNDLKTLILKSPDATTIAAHAVSKGMKTLREDGLLKAASGMTSLEEVIRVTEED